MDRWETQLRKGVVELAVLATIARGETYGYHILEQLRDGAGLAVPESTVYPVLTRLAREGAVAVRSAASPTGPPRRYYRLTPAGRDRLRHMAVGWQRVADSLSHWLEGVPQ